VRDFELAVAAFALTQLTGAREDYFKVQQSNPRFAATA